MRTEAPRRVSDNVVPRTYWAAVEACGPEATELQVAAMARKLEALYAERPTIRALHRLALRGGDFHRYVRAIEFPEQRTTTTANS